MDKLLPIKLGVSGSNWEQFIGRINNPKFIKAKEKILTRDQHKCQFCGFLLKKFSYIVNVDQNYSNNKTSNLATSCMMCAQSSFINSIGKNDYTGGELIILPELKQHQLNLFCRLLFCCLISDQPYKNKLQATYLSLQERREDVERIFGKGAYNPSILGQTMLDQRDKKELSQHPVFQNLRVLPKKQAFTKESEFFIKTVYSNLNL